MRRRDTQSASTRNALIWLCIFATAAAFGVFGRKQEQAVFHGPFYVVDGDTLTNGGNRLRLRGMDAPEMKQTCGEGDSAWACGATARQELLRLVVSGAACTAEGRDKYRRWLVRCTASGMDIGAEMVRSGNGVAYGDYEREEGQARAERRGIWTGPFERPSDWRKRNRLLASEDGEEDASPKVHWSLSRLGDSLFGK